VAIAPLKKATWSSEKRLEDCSIKIGAF